MSATGAPISAPNVLHQYDNLDVKLPQAQYNRRNIMPYLPNYRALRVHLALHV
jgi:hypothetical protein